MIVVESAEHEQFRASVRKLIDREAPLARSVADGESDAGYDRALWRRLSAELGVAGLSIPEPLGGAGVGPLEESIVAGELGSALTCTPYLATISLAANLLLAAGDDAACEKYLPDLAAAERTATVVLRATNGRVRADAVPIRAVRDGARWRLTGSSRFVLDGHTADLLFVAAATPDGVALFAVDGSEPGLTRTRMRTLDQLRPMAHLTFDEVEGQPFGRPATAWDAVERALDLATVAVAAEQTACAEFVLRQTVEYLGVRVQFARTIGSFQAVKHRCADTVVGNDRARSAVTHAVWAAATDPDRLPAAAAMAALVCGPAFLHAAQENVQLHGGIGFTWEHPAHRYVRRATADMSLLADRRYYEDRLLGGLGIDVPRATSTDQS
jgi:alkylation response protein AidB-like acyl-CoA dehydrogenase